MALLSSVPALTSVASPDSVHHSMTAPLRWMTSLFPGGGEGEGSWWRLGGLDVPSIGASRASRR